MYMYIYTYINTLTHTRYISSLNSFETKLPTFTPFLFFISFFAYFLLEHHAPPLNHLLHMNVCSLKGNQPLEVLITAVTVPLSRSSIMPSWFLSAV
jgi:hypothetical protein